MGLFWSMRWKTCVSCEMLPAPVATVRLVASGGGRTLATASFTRRARSAGVTVHATTLAAEGFVGCFYAPPAEAPHPAPGILRLGGSEGGLHCDAVASLLATRGYPTLSLAYFGMPGLPEDLENIPLEYFRPALRWLAQQPGVDPAKLVVLGQSRGGECGFLLADAFPELVHSVVSYVGPSTVLPTFSGNGDEAAWTAEGRPIATGTELPVETVAGPIFLVSGAMDEVWPTAVSADAITRRLREHQRTDYTSLIYQAAGHAVGTAVPNVAIGTWGGGSAAGDAHGRADSWPKLLAFLDRLR
jgi:dienelactone hydrolase